MIYQYKLISSLFCLLFLISSNIVLGQEEEDLIFPFQEQSGGLYLDDPVKYNAAYDVATGMYILRQQVGGVAYGNPIYLTQQEYFNLLLNNSITDYYKDKSQALDDQYRTVRGRNREEDATDSGLVLPSLQVKNKIFQTIFGGDKIELIPSGYASLDLGVFFQHLDNPQILPQNRKSFAIDLQQRIQMSVLGKVGENLQMQANYDTQAGFGFENRMNLAWRPNMDGGEDNIIQNIEFGNVSMPLSTSLITGAQSLFGAKGEFKFGNTYVTTLFSQQESEARNITVQGGGVVNTFKIYAKDYEPNQHYFLSQYFRDNYDTALSSYPVISSQVNVTRLEVWVIDKGNANQENRRAMLALRDVGDDGNLPQNGTLYNRVSNLGGIRNSGSAESVMNGAGLVDDNGSPYAAGEHFMVHENVRLLSPSEYKYYPSLGYISLRQPLNDNELLGVSFQYTLTSQPGISYTVGEFSDQQSELLITKLIKSNTNVNTNSPMWDLMMKNIYSLNSFQLSPEDFRLNVFYQDPDVGSGALNYLQGTSRENETLLQLLNMDRLNMVGEVQPAGNGTFGDGLFDYVPGITIDEENGKVIFTTVEPFGQTIANAIGTQDSDYVLEELYDELPIRFEQNTSVNRYFLEGQYVSAGGSGIPLGAFNVPQGSVKVTANGQQLIEGVDYTVDYQLGRVQIINQMIKDSGVPINISLENRSTFNMQTRSLMGLNVEHRFSDNFLVGATYMNYAERIAGTQQKPQYDAEPVSNSIVGANVLYNGESDWLTRLTDKIPFVDTETTSKINFSAEGAYLMPGVNKTQNNFSYIDDFEDSQSNISLMDVYSWKLASTPVANAENPNPDFDPSIYNPDDFSLNYNRRLLAWYNIDPRFYGIGGNSPLSNAEISNHASRRVEARELFSNRDYLAGTPSYLNTLDISYFPEERGPYNLNPNWQNENIEDLWAGITRPLTITNLVQANVEYVEFWMMDPYADGMVNSPDAKIMLHLGNVSEDLLRDGNLVYENGINQENNTPEESIWGQQPSNYPILYSFDTEGEERMLQDVGYDGLLNQQEAVLPGYSNFSANTNPITGELDPAADDFVYYLDERWENFGNSGYIPERYKYFTNPEANSPSETIEVGSATPDTEDINLDYNLDRIENYNQYTIPLGQQNLNLDNRFIVDQKRVNVQFENNQTGEVNWYLFRVPVSEYDQNAGAASDDVLTSARFMRLILKGFETNATIRIGSFDMVRSDWRRYSKNIYPEIAVPEGQEEIDITDFSIGSVNIEENSAASPAYVVPPGIEREKFQTNAGLQSQNEASMVLNVENLNAADARGVFKNTNLDLRRYKQIKMFSHVHAGENGMEANGDLKLFLRLGSDLANNYYEYEFPMEYSPRSAQTPTAVWPLNNMLEINTDEFVLAKTSAYEADNLDRFPYQVDEQGRMIYVKGRPSLGNISTMMIGVRNTGNTEINDAIVWVNELRLSEVSNEGGYAAMANLNVALGDFAQVNATGSITSVGFGAIDQGPVERQQEEIKNYAVNTQVNLDKFLPEKWGLKIPFNYTISEQFIDPKFNPLDNDIEFDEDPRRDALEQVVRTYNKTTTYAFNNIRKERIGGRRTPKFYDVENFSLSFLYNSDYYRDIYTTYSKEKNLQASLNYNHNFKPKYIEPFKDWRMVQDTAQSAKYLQWVKAFNINYKPTRLSFRTDILRTYNEQQYRDINSYLIDNATSVQFNPIFSNNFLFNWQYNVGFDLTKSLRIDFTSATRTLSDVIASAPDDDMIFKDIFSVGRPINYNQRLQVNWKTPLRLLPYFEWADVEVGYAAQYDWRARLTNRFIVNAEEENIGNISQNAQTITVLGNLSFDDLYMQFKPFQRLDSLKQARRSELDSLNRSWRELAEKKNGLRTINKSKVNLKTKFGVRDYLLMTVQSIKRGQFNYNKNSGIILPGMIAEPNFIGQGSDGAGPTAAFMFGSQYDIRRRAVENGWITNSIYLTEPYSHSVSETFTANLQVEPTPSLLIDFNASRNLVENMYQSGYNVLLPDGRYGFEAAFENRQENFTMSTWSFNTAFSDRDALYNELRANAQIISQRQGRLWYGITAVDPDGYAEGLGITNADVLVPAFLATYRGSTLPDTNFGHKRSIPLPNWNITYSGLSNNPWIAKRFDRVQLSHNYTSSYTVSGVTSNLDRFSQGVSVDNGIPVSGLDGNGNLYSLNQYGAVTMMEAFAPLVGLDLTLRNSLQLRAQYNKDRIVSLSMSNYTLTEDYGDEYIVGLGYILKGMKLNMRYMGKKKTLEGDVNFRLDFALRDNQTTIRRILEDESQIMGGQNIFSLKFNAEWLLSQNLNLSLFYDQMITKYKISTAFPLSTTRAGIRATFKLGN
ncbi:cell surface protein SprA [Flavobacteriaceae bacterium Ap0902]|nr:cell surface protein SprA [Flavobacteriaceae bacterium Ap0902]